VTPGQIRIAPGSSTTVTVAEDNSLGTSGPTTIAYTATAPSGLTAGPATATLTADAGKTASTTATIPAASGTATGYYQVEFAAHASNGATLPDVSLLVTVAAAGESIPTAYVSNYSDNTVTPVDTRTHNAGPAIPVGGGPDGMTVAGGKLFVADNNTNNVTVIGVPAVSVATSIG